MRLRLICPGKIKESWLESGISEYVKRLSKYCSVDIVEVADSPDSLPVERALAAEGDLILSRINTGDIVWVMDLHGKLMTSEEISEILTDDMERGGASLTVVIGGSNGLDPRVTARANRRICLGKVTLTHQMTRLIVLEQIYRGFKIARGEKYHK
ncbi:MAG: 23S rRNA (pseudouridine(1915)-N(3))-methyltransferase RlmH [Clostridiales bacterium]|nr:23S rRNA (pseudouridine(1915)-N(3))-methyltransferase RlmH [Clostridiales bacterium]